jgi:hypothetical protein
VQFTYIVLVSYGHVEAEKHGHPYRPDSVFIESMPKKYDVIGNHRIAEF